MIRTKLSAVFKGSIKADFGLLVSSRSSTFLEEKAHDYLHLFITMGFRGI
jgi:hypothetical protein